MRLVVKLGTSVLTDGTAFLSRQRMLEIVQQVAHLHQQGHEIIVVSSGAMAAGKERLGFPDLGRFVPAKQMLSAVGQSRLMETYSTLFDIFGIVVAQVLLTRDDLASRTGYLNARNTLLTLLEHRIVTIINENDTTATHEIRVGDNDNLSALVANLTEAQMLVILTDQPGLFTADPRTHRDARLIPHIEQINNETWALAGSTGSPIGTGGMVTKIQAAQLAGRSGVVTVIAAGREPDALRRIVEGERLGTRFDPVHSQLESRKRWLLAEKTRGAVSIDQGAVDVLRKGGASLLPVGVTAVRGNFERGALLAVLDPQGATAARGLSNYSSGELRQLCRAQSSQIVEILGYSYGDEVIHRNNMVLLD